MRHIIRLLLGIVALSGALSAKDGLFFSDTPPITLRFGKDDTFGLFIAFTNTSDSVIHAVVLTSEGKGKKKSEVIIDTIEPHKTFYLYGVTNILVDHLDIANAASFSITCKDYSKPLLIKDWWATKDLEPANKSP